MIPYIKPLIRLYLMCFVWNLTECASPRWMTKQRQERNSPDKETRIEGGTGRNIWKGENSKGPREAEEKIPENFGLNFAEEKCRMSSSSGYTSCAGSRNRSKSVANCSSSAGCRAPASTAAERGRWESADSGSWPARPSTARRSSTPTSWQWSPVDCSNGPPPWIRQTVSTILPCKFPGIFYKFHRPIV